LVESGIEVMSLIELLEENIVNENRQSSKGNQLKWSYGHKWYKADYTGYEGLSEYVISNLLKKTDLGMDEFIVYNTEEIAYKHTKFTGCVSNDFLKKGWQLITLERLFQNAYGQSITKSIYAIDDSVNRLKFIVEQVERITGLKEFGRYMSKLMLVDAFFLNEDRHMHNIAVLMDEKGDFTYCPIYDNGAGLLSDTKMDYPISGDLNVLIKEVKPKTFWDDFDEQLEVAERLYGQGFNFGFEKKDIDRILDAEQYYANEEKERVKQLLLWQMRKYSYLFT